jgi:hypothetical protein
MLGAKFESSLYQTEEFLIGIFRQGLEPLNTILISITTDSFGMLA